MNVAFNLCTVATCAFFHFFATVRTLGGSAQYVIRSTIETCRLVDGKEVCGRFEQLDESAKEELEEIAREEAALTFWGNSHHRLEFRLQRRANGQIRVWLTGRRLTPPRGELTVMGSGQTVTAAVVVAFCERNLYCAQHTFAPECL